MPATGKTVPKGEKSLRGSHTLYKVHILKQVGSQGPSHRASKCHQRRCSLWEFPEGLPPGSSVRGHIGQKDKVKKSPLFIKGINFLSPILLLSE